MKISVRVQNSVGEWINSPIEEGVTQEGLDSFVEVTKDVLGSISGQVHVEDGNLITIIPVSNVARLEIEVIEK